MVDPHLADTYTAADTILAWSEIGLYYFWSVNVDQDSLITFPSDKIVQTGSTTFDVRDSVRRT